MKRVVVRTLLIVRWWAGVTYVLGGVGVMISGPILLAAGNGGGLYALLGGSELAVLGWVVHPWGLQRRRRIRQAGSQLPR